MQRARTSTAAIVYAAIGVMSFGFGGAQAGDTKVMAAVACERSASVGYLLFGSVYNSSTTTAGSISCAILRDNTSAKPLKIQVSVVDNSSVASPNGDISCRVRAANRFSTFAVLGPSIKTAQGTNPAGQVLDLPIPSTLYVNGAYVVSCVIPRRNADDAISVVASILIDEVSP